MYKSAIWSVLRDSELNPHGSFPSALHSKPVGNWTFVILKLEVRKFTYKPMRTFTLNVALELKNLPDRGNTLKMSKLGLVY